MPVQLFDSYGRGIIQRPHPRRISAAYVRQALNVAYVGGMRRQRPALRPYQAAPCSAAVKGVGVHVAASGQRHVLVAVGAAVQRVAPYGDPTTLSLSALPSALQTRTAPTRAYFLGLSGGANLTFLYDGVNPTLKYDGTSLTKMGITAGPTPAAPTTGNIGGSIANGHRKYVLTLASVYHEGNPTPAASARVVDFAGATGTQRATFTSPTQGVEFDDPQVTTWKLWRTEDDGETYYLVGSAAIGVTIDDTVSDDVLTAGTPLVEIVNAEPQAPILAMVEHRGQILAVMNDDRNIVHHSNFDPAFEIPEGWPAAWQTPIAHGDGDALTALASFHEYALAWKSHSLWALVGDWPEMTPQPVFVAGTSSSIGCPAQGAVRQLENEVHFASRDGVYAIRRESGSEAGVAAIRVSDAIDDLWGASDINQCSASIYDRKKRTLVFFGKGRTS